MSIMEIKIQKCQMTKMNHLRTLLIYKLIMSVTANTLEISQNQSVNNNMKKCSGKKLKIEHVESLKMNKKKFAVRLLTQLKSMMVFQLKQEMMTNTTITAYSTNNKQIELKNNSPKNLLRMRKNYLNSRKDKLSRLMA